MSDDKPMPAVEVMDKQGTNMAMFTFAPGDRTQDHVQVYKATTQVDSSSVAHESVHIPQWEAADPSRPDQNDKQSLRDVSHLPRGFVNLSPLLPRREDFDSYGPTSSVLYFTSPIEMQAFVEELSLVRLSSSGAQKSPAFEQSGLGGLEALLQKAGAKLNTAEDPNNWGPWLRSFLRAQPQSRLEPANRPAPSGNMDPDVAVPSFMVSAQKIFVLAERFNAAMNSQVWEGEDTAQLKRLLDEMNELLDTPWGESLNGEEILAEVASTLDSAWNSLSAGKGEGLRQPAGYEPSREEYLEAKTEPWRLLEADVEAQQGERGMPKSGSALSRPPESSFRFKPGTALPALLDVKKSCGFFDAVADLRSKIRQGTPLEPQDVAGPVMRLAARLTGVDEQKLTAIFMPEASLYLARTMAVPHEPGLTDGPNQKRKASYDRDLLMLNVPLQSLRDNPYLEGQLTKFAFDVTEHMIELMDAHKKGEVILNKEGQNLVAIFQNRLSRALGEGVMVARDKFVAENPDSIAAKILNAPKAKRDLLWHESDRPDLKAKAREGRPGASAAQRAYEAGTWRDWHLDMVAMRRALVGADWSQEVKRTSGLPEN